MTRTKICAIATILATLAIGATAAKAAEPGTYTIFSPCDGWQAVVEPGFFATSTTCPQFSVESTVGPGRLGPYAGWVQFTPLPGTAIVHVEVDATVVARDLGWEAHVLLRNADDEGSAITVASCKDSLPCLAGRFAGRAPNGVDQFRLQVQCRYGVTCSRDISNMGFVDAYGPTFTIRDPSSPAVSLVGGSALEGWRRGTAGIVFSASDNLGIKDVYARVDGQAEAEDHPPCEFEFRRTPCENRTNTTLSIDTTRIADGVHSLDVYARDAADNGAQSASYTLLADNNAPAAPVRAEVVGGEGWRRHNDFSIEFRAPDQGTAAPIDALGYQLCPGPLPADRVDGCMPMQFASQLKAVNETNPSEGMRVSGLTVPEPGDYQVRLVLRDAAGNFDPRNALVLRFRFDPDPPQVRILPQDAGDPARLRVRATDAVSGVARGELELRRDGEQVWRPVATELGKDGFTGFADDEALPAGTYAVRARAVDAAGNEAGSDRREDGSPATIVLPVRSATRLEVGALGRRSCRGRGKRRACTRSRRTRVSLDFRGRRPRLFGRLLGGDGKPLSNTEVLLIRTDRGGAERAPKSLRTSATGRFSYRPGAGPARTLRFRYPGDSHRRGATAVVDWRVRGTTTLRGPRRAVINGEYATFSGRVRGRPLPASGKLVELQVYTRRRWRTFAQPRTNRTGSWSHRYRFEQITRPTRFRFRARVRAEAGYPYLTGVSRQVRVLVRGLGR